MVVLLAQVGTIQLKEGIVCFEWFVAVLTSETSRMPHFSSCHKIIFKQRFVALCTRVCKERCIVFFTVRFALILHVAGTTGNIKYALSTEKVLRVECCPQSINASTFD